MKLHIQKCSGPINLPAWGQVLQKVDAGDTVYLATVLYSEKISQSEINSCAGIAVVTRNTYQLACKLGEISLLEVRKDVRRQGIAIKLLQAISNDWKDSHLIVESTEYNQPAWKCYMRSGFVYLWTDLVENVHWFLKSGPSSSRSAEEVRALIEHAYNVSAEHKITLPTAIPDWSLRA